MVCVFSSKMVGIVPPVGIVTKEGQPRAREISLVMALEVLVGLVGWGYFDDAAVLRFWCGDGVATVMRCEWFLLWLWWCCGGWGFDGVAVVLSFLAVAKIFVSVEGLLC